VTFAISIRTLIMGRRGGGARTSTRTASKPSGSTSSNNVPARTSAPSAAPAPTAGRAPAPGQPTVVNQGPSFMSSVASTAAGVAIGHVVADKFMHGGDQEAAPAAAAAGNAAAQEGMGPCMIPQRTFNQCIAANNGNISLCQWAFDQMQTCMRDPKAFSNTLQ